MTIKNLNDVTVEEYKKNCEHMIKDIGYGQASNSFEKTEMKKVMDAITDWNDIDQLYDATAKIQNIMLKYDQLAMSKKRWAEREEQVRWHFTHLIRMQFAGVSVAEAEHIEYQDLFIKWGMMKTREDGMYSFAHLDIFKATEMFFEMCKIRAHWAEKVEAGLVEKKFVGYISF